MTPAAPAFTEFLQLAQVASIAYSLDPSSHTQRFPLITGLAHLAITMAPATTVASYCANKLVPEPMHGRRLVIIISAMGTSSMSPVAMTAGDVCSNYSWSSMAMMVTRTVGCRDSYYSWLSMTMTMTARNTGCRDCYYIVVSMTVMTTMSTKARNTG